MRIFFSTTFLTGAAAAVCLGGISSAAAIDPGGFPAGTFQIKSDRAGTCVTAYRADQTRGKFAGQTYRGVTLSPCGTTKNQQWTYNPKTQQLQSLGLDGKQCAAIGPKVAALDAARNHMIVGPEHNAAPISKEARWKIKLAWCGDQLTTPAILKFQTKDGKILLANGRKWSYWTPEGHGVTGREQGDAVQQWTFVPVSG